MVPPGLAYSFQCACGARAVHSAEEMEDFMHSGCYVSFGDYLTFSQGLKGLYRRADEV
jgi:hypothetical protein